MSGIYLQGVELPPNDEYLHLRIDGNGYVSAQIRAVECVCFLADTDRKAIEISHHGRLGDLDSLKGIFSDELNRYKRFPLDNDDKQETALLHLESTVRIITNAHTIIPADQEKEDK